MAESILYMQPNAVENETAEEDLSVAERKMQVARRLAATFTECVTQYNTGEFGYRKLYRHLHDLHQLHTEPIKPGETPTETPIDDKISNAVNLWQQSQRGPAQYSGGWEVVARGAWDIKNALEELDRPPLPEDME